MVCHPVLNITMDICYNLTRVVILLSSRVLWLFQGSLGGDNLTLAAAGKSSYFSFVPMDRRLINTELSYILWVTGTFKYHRRINVSQPHYSVMMIYKKIFSECKRKSSTNPGCKCKITKFEGWEGIWGENIFDYNYESLDWYFYKNIYI